MAADETGTACDQIKGHSAPPALRFSRGIIYRLASRTAGQQEWFPALEEGKSAGEGRSASGSFHLTSCSRRQAAFLAVQPQAGPILARPLFETPPFASYACLAGAEALRPWSSQAVACSLKS